MVTPLYFIINNSFEYLPFTCQGICMVIKKYNTDLGRLLFSAVLTALTDFSEFHS